MPSFESARLKQLGLSPFFIQQLHTLEPDGDEHHRVARIACERRGEYELVGEQGQFRAALSGRLEHELNRDQRPAVGDWVLAEPGDPVGRVHRLLERQNALRRAEVLGSSTPQTLAANVDLCCVVCALTTDDADEHAQRRALNPRRLERYLTMAASSRIPALVLVNKADLLASELAQARLDELGQRLPGAELLLVSAHSGQGFDALARALLPGTSAALLGSSGVGKSSLVNALLGEVAQKVGAERSDDTRGRHTTTERHLLELPSGAWLVDTPGMRELALWADDDTDVSAGFDDVEQFAEGCRFRDCRHQGEPGCAVQAALEAGELSSERLEHAQKLERELEHQRRRADVRLQQAAIKQRKLQARATRAVMRLKGRKY